MTGAIEVRSEPIRRNRCRRRTPRHGLDLLLDSLFRPRGWAAATARVLGLQGSLEVTPHEVITARPRGSPSLRIGFASDFHAGPTTHMSLLEDACRALDEARLDVLLLGGDYVSVRAQYAERLAPLLAGIRAPLGKFAVLGNHDLRANCDELEDRLTGAGVRMLTNASVGLPAPHGDVSICGLDDPLHGDPRPDDAFADARGTRIVLMHAPDGLLYLKDRAFRLALCGHTHGGQIAWPWGRALVNPAGRLVRRFPQGTFEIGGSSRTLIVSRGIGCSTIPVRAFARPQIHICLLRGLTAGEAAEYR